MIASSKMLLSASILIYFLLNLQSSSAEIADCSFYDTVDISEGQRLSNGSYLYEGLLIPAHLTAKYEFKLLANGDKEQVPSHVRGCVCKLRTCVRFCCPHDHIMDMGECYANMTTEENELLDPMLNVTLDDGSVVQRHYKKELMVQWDLPKPCDDMFYLDNRDIMDEYTLFENGRLLRHYDQVYLDKSEYCLQHRTFGEGNNNSIRIIPHNCLILPSRTGQTVVMITSLICLVLTIAVYLCVKKLMNLEGKCFICYMMCLFFGYLFLLLDLWELSLDFCKAAGFLGYFFVMAAFFWLSIISRHYWKCLTNPCASMNIRSERAFLLYSCFAWAMPLALTGVTYLADNVVNNEEWQPRVGDEGHCWIYTKSWSAMVYFYGPMVLLILFNITMFVLTAKHIIDSKRTLRKIARNEGRIQKLNSDKQNYTQFLLLFTVMGMSWSFEIFSYLVQREKLWVNIFLVADYFNWSQGVIIFVLFILRRKTLVLFKKQIFPKQRAFSRSATQSTIESISQTKRHFNMT
uniref:Probable G-protein coupled receptor Mth-like 2 n=1 Tax=Drosophila melanogaster TaxID=7227 RepID=MTH2_DROME|eukprot:NP_788462.2 methuselah-like 2 [Drosophila melanogaster]